MINEDNFPTFKYFMQAYMGDFSNFFEQAKEFKRSERIPKTKILKNEVINLRDKKEAWEIQAFMNRKYGVRLTQKEVPDIIDEIIKGLES